MQMNGHSERKRHFAFGALVKQLANEPAKTYTELNPSLDLSDRILGIVSDISATLFKTTENIFDLDRSRSDMR